MARILTISFLLIFACALTLSGQDEKNAQEKIPEVKTEEVQIRTLYETIVTSGSTMAVRHSRLSFQVPGVVSTVPAEMGSKVSKGEPLAQLEDTIYKLRVEQAQAALQAASANLDKLKGGFRPEEISQAEAGVKAAKTGYEQAKRDFDRMKKLADEKQAVAENSLEQARTGMELARAAYEQACKQLELLKKGFQEQDIKAAAAQVKIAEASLKMAEKNIEDTVLHAPYDGIVTRTFINPGDTAGGMPGACAMEIMDISKLELIVPVPDMWQNQVSKESQAIVNLDGGPGNLKTKVVAVSCAINPSSRAFDVKLLIDNPDLSLKAGMFARVRIIYGERKSIAVPSNAVIEDAHLSYVLLYEEGKAVRKNVKTGIESDGYTEIKAGLAEGQAVIHEGNFGLSNGTRVKLTEKEEK